MESRLKLQALLEEILGNENVYNAPPDNMSYPAITYKLTTFDVKYACNAKYITKQCYSVTFISPDTDTAIINKLFNLPLCSYDRPYDSDGLHHTVFKLYF